MCFFSGRSRLNFLVGPAGCRGQTFSPTWLWCGLAISHCLVFAAAAAAGRDDLTPVSLSAGEFLHNVDFKVPSDNLPLLVVGSLCVCLRLLSGPLRPSFPSRSRVYFSLCVVFVWKTIHMQIILFAF